MSKKREQELSDETTLKRSLILWPGVVIVLLQWILRFTIPVIFPGAVAIGVFGGLLGGLAVIVWWAFFSRARRSERWSAIVLMIVALFATSRIVHESIGTGFQGLMFYVYAIPVLSLAFVVWAVTSRRLSTGSRRVMMIITILLASGVWTLFRSAGITGEGSAEFAWRWSETPEERLLVRTDNRTLDALPVTRVSETGSDWPGFRGANRDAIIRDIQIQTDWTSSPPVEIWRRPIGPGCSSFAIHGNLLYTQEQRGEDEIVSCYYLNTGQPVWQHRDAARFWDSHAGAGPRGTPTLHDGSVYTLGATGILNALDAIDGTVIWSRNADSDAKVEVPGWGFASSPLVVDDLVIVAVAGTLIAYDLVTGGSKWSGPDGGAGYSSPQLITIDGIKQVLLMSEVGATSLSLIDGSLLWRHLWKEERIVQPALMSNGDLLLSAGGMKGMRRISVKLGRDGWRTEERWTSVQLKPNFNDFVVHKGHAFGFNGPILTCIDIGTGERKWKGGRYGGQLLLLADQDLILVLSEQGELVLVLASADQYKELARFPVIEGKTWNHPVLVGDMLVVRNSQEMAAFRLSLADNRQELP